MFKTVCFGVLLFTIAYAAEIERLDNLIGYEEVPYRGFSMPYPYQEDRKERVIVEPLFSDVLVPAVPAVAAVGVSKLGLIAKVATTAVAVVKKVFVFVIANAPALIIGTLFAFGICKFTPICAKLDSVKSLLAVPLELRTYATPERLSQATDFVRTAIRKYRSLQNQQ